MELILCDKVTKGSCIMKTLLEKLSKLVRHNVPLVVAICIAASILFWFGGCQSTTLSLTTPNLKVTRAELKIEYDAEMAMLEQQLNQLEKIVILKEQDLDRQDAFKRKLFEIGVAISEGGEVNPVGVATSLFALLFSGSMMNSLVKDRIIKTNNKNKK